MLFCASSKQRLLIGRIVILDMWLRNKLPAKDFAELIGISKYTLYTWKKRFTSFGSAGLMDQPRSVPRESRVADVTRRAILILNQTHPEWCRLGVSSGVRS